MIKQTELRIGNIVSFHGVHYRVLEICQDFYSLDNDLNYVTEVNRLDSEDEDIEPIPLKPEILEKAGFVLQPKKTAIYIKGRIKLWLGHNGAIAYLKNEDTDESYYIQNNPQSLHQLQNLYFALTGEELEINL